MGRQDAKFHIVDLIISTILFSQGTCTPCLCQCYRLVTKYIIIPMCMVSGAYWDDTWKGWTSAQCAVGSLACGPLRSPAAGGTAQPMPSSWTDALIVLIWMLFCWLQGTTRGRTAQQVRSQHPEPSCLGLRPFTDAENIMETLSSSIPPSIEWGQK